MTLKPDIACNNSGVIQCTFLCYNILMVCMYIPCISRYLLTTLPFICMLIFLLHLNPPFTCRTMCCCMSFTAIQVRCTDHTKVKWWTGLSTTSTCQPQREVDLFLRYTYSPLFHMVVGQLCCTYADRTGKADNFYLVYAPKCLNILCLYICNVPVDKCNILSYLNIIAFIVLHWSMQYFYWQQC